MINPNVKVVNTYTPEEVKLLIKAFGEHDFFIWVELKSGELIMDNLLFREGEPSYYCQDSSSILPWLGTPKDWTIEKFVDALVEGTTDVVPDNWKRVLGFYSF